MVGKLDIKNLPLDKNTKGKDIGGLTYDPESGIFYTSVSHWSSDQTNIWSELVTFKIKENGKERMIAEVKSVGVITCGYVSSASFNEDDGQIYAFAVDKSGSWDSPYISSLVRIDPANADMTKLFEMPYHTILGLAKKPAQKPNKKSDEIVFYSWVNAEKHHYAKINVHNRSINLFQVSTDTTGVNSDAMLFKDFKIRHPK